MNVVTVSSDFARFNARSIGALASQGFITTKLTSNAHGNVWRVTAKGLSKL